MYIKKQKIYISSIHILKEVNSKMKKRLIATIVIILVIFVSGCGSNTTQSTTDYHIGTQGIVMNFMQNSPPAEVFDGDNVPFIVEVRNLGAFTTSPSFWLSGHDEDHIIHIKWKGKTINNLEARDENNPVGGYDVLEEQSVSITLPDNVDSYDTNMKLTTCYHYITHASAQVCVDPDPTQNQDDACTASDISLGSGQGGPVAITSIGVDSSREKVRFTINIANEGDGTIIEGVDKIISSCTNLKASNIDIVSVSPQKLSGHILDCKPNPVRLVSGRGVIYCEASMSGFPKTAFTTILMLDLNYGYKSSISRTISVKRI